MEDCLNGRGRDLSLFMLGTSAKNSHIRRPGGLWWWGDRRESNSRRTGYKAAALPLSYGHRRPGSSHHLLPGQVLERRQI